MENESKICQWCKNEIRPLDNHVSNTDIESSENKHLIRVTCQLTRYYKIVKIELT